MFALGNGSEYSYETSSHQIAVRSRHSSGTGRRRMSNPRGGVSEDRALETVKSVFEVPLEVSKAFRDVQFKTLLGVSGSIAWYTADAKLFLWNFSTSHLTTIQCDGVITAVAIGVPDLTVMDPTVVPFIAVVCTENTVTLVPLDGEYKQVRSTVAGVPVYFLTLPNKTCIFSQVFVTVTGRIMLYSAQNPNYLYEFVYHKKPSWFKAKCYFGYHYLGGGVGGAGHNLLGAITHAVARIIPGSPSLRGSPTTTNGPAIFGTKNCWKYFAMVAVSSHQSVLRFYEFAPGFAVSEIYTESWKSDVVHALDSKLVIAKRNAKISCFGELALTDIGVSAVLDVEVYEEEGEAARRVFVDIVGSLGELVSVEILPEGVFQIIKSRMQLGDSSSDAKKFQRLSSGAAAEQAPVYAVGTMCRSSDLLVTGSGTKIFVSSSNGGAETVDIGSSIISVTRADKEISCGISCVSEFVCLTGKGVVNLKIDTCANFRKPEFIQSLGVASIGAFTVADAMRVLSQSDLAFAFKPLIIRAFENVRVNSLEGEKDYCFREKRVKPISGGVWVGGANRLVSLCLSHVRRESVFNRRGGVRIGVKALKSVRERIVFVANFLRSIGGALEKSATQNISTKSIVPSSSVAAMREFMHANSSRDQFVRAQVLLEVTGLANRLGEIGEVLGLLEVAAKLKPAATTANVPVDMFPQSVTIDQLSRSLLTSICENILRTTGGSLETVDELKQVCPGILCSVSPSAVSMSTAAIASIMRCAWTTKAPPVLVQSVKMLARSTPSVETVLSELGGIFAPTDGVGQQHHAPLIIALLEGLQERLISETVAGPLLHWATTNLPETDNFTVFDWFFKNGFSIHLAKYASAGDYLEKFLVPRVTSGGRPFVEAYGQLLAIKGRSEEAADIIEKIVFAPSGDENPISLDDRIELLELVFNFSNSAKRWKNFCLAKYVQKPFLEWMTDNRCQPSDVQFLSKTLLNPIDLLEELKHHQCFHLAVRCCAFIPSVKESELVELWTKALFRGGLNAKNFMLETKTVADETGSNNVWKKIETTIAIAEYVSGTTWDIAEEFLIQQMGMSVLSVIELYVKIVRELNVWLARIPKSDEFAAELVTKEAIQKRLTDVVINLVEHYPEEVSRNSKRLLSLLVLLKNSLPDLLLNRVETLIDKLSTDNDKNSIHASLPAM